MFTYTGLGVCFDTHTTRSRSEIHVFVKQRILTYFITKKMNAIVRSDLVVTGRSVRVNIGGASTCVIRTRAFDLKSSLKVKDLCDKMSQITISRYTLTFRIYYILFVNFTPRVMITRHNSSESLVVAKGPARQ